MSIKSIQTQQSHSHRHSNRHLGEAINSLKAKIALMLTVAPALLTVSMAVISLSLYESNARSEHIRIAYGAARLAVQCVDPDMVDRYLTEGKDVPGYRSAETKLYSIRANTPDIEYLYVYKIMPDGCHVVFDLDSEGMPASHPGEIIEFDEAFAPDLELLLAGKRIQPRESNDKYGWLLTVYEPVYNSDGKCVCYVGVDISMATLRTYKRTFIRKIIILFSGIFVLILTIGQWIANKYLSKPINSIAAYAGDFMSNKGDIDAMNICVDKIRSLNIKTGDEVENLYHSFSKMTEDTVMHIIDIKQQSDTITKMQNERIDMMVQHATELENRVEERTRALKLEKERSQSLLLNILPIDVADELTRNPDKTIAKKFSNATVLFTDIVGFTKMSDNMAAEEVVTMLNSLISKFDERAKREHIEKIKTIGDAYMAAVGLSEASNQDASTMIQFAQGLIQDVRDFNAQNNSNLQIRLGINTGNLVAGVIGKSKFIYDIWGDTVNVASRMESTGRPMKIHVTETTFEQTKDKFSYSESAEIEVKGKGLMKTYFL
ncbi:MAG: hypothetical protein IKN25_03125 [Spirochaetales bacterium]|nr:hypothetical protein [Spirochaetales bacterium]